MKGVWIGAAAWLLAGCAGDDGASDAARLFIRANVAPDGNCVAHVDAEPLTAGVYDIAARAAGNSNPDANGCATPYMMVLVLEAQVEVEPVGPGVDTVAPVILRRASVTLTTQAGEPLELPNLPNPRWVDVHASASYPEGDGQPALFVADLDAINAADAPLLADFAGDTIHIRLELEGITRDGEELRTPEFIYPVSLCDGCLSRCRHQDIEAEGLLPEDVTGAECPAAQVSGMDGRICIDSDC